MTVTLRTITVGELRDLLEDHADDVRVIIASDYGDRAHTEQALPLRGEVDTVTISESGYSSSGYAITDPDDDDEDSDDEDRETFLVLR